MSSLPRLSSSPFFRRAVLGGALLLALAVAAMPESPPARAATASSRILVAQDASTAKEVGDAIREATREASQQIAREAERAADEAARAAREARADADAATRHKGLRINDGNYDSFEDFMTRAPALAAMVTGIVFIVFLTPILLIGLVIWYKLRRNRMQNETMLKLAERGIVPTPETLQAVSSGRVDASLARAASALPPAEQVQVLARRAAWSDLRKGVVMGTIGLALCVHAMVEDGQPGWLGLVLLFVGAGYVALWYFEEREAAGTVQALRAPATPPARGPGFE